MSRHGPRDELRPKQWVGDLRTCFLLEEGWAFRTEVSRFQLKGRAGWRLPQAFAAAIGLAEGESRFLEPSDAHLGEEVALSLEDGKCLGGPIDAPLRALGASEGDVAFFAVRSGGYTIRLRRRAELVEDGALSRLLWSCGFDPTEDAFRASAWPLLTRAVGGSGSGREDLRLALLRRRDESLIGLLEEIERGGRRVGPTRAWPDLWASVMPMSHETTTLTLLGGDGTVRTALGVLDTSGQPPSDLVSSGGGLLWLHRAVSIDPADLTALLREGARGLVVAAHKPAWVRWVRVEHGARRAALLGAAWEIRRAEGSWWVSTLPHEDLVSALERVTIESEDTPAAPTTAPRAAYPRSALAFDRAVDDAARRDLRRLRADGLAGFVAVYGSGRELAGASLMDVLV